MFGADEDGIGMNNGRDEQMMHANSTGNVDDGSSSAEDGYTVWIDPLYICINI